MKLMAKTIGGSFGSFVVHLGRFSSTVSSGLSSSIFRFLTMSFYHFWPRRTVM